MLYAATSSDAVKYGLTPAVLELYPNGEFAADDNYYKTIVKPYMNEQFFGQFNAAAEEYAHHFVDPATRHTAGRKPFDENFVAAFVSEYGLTPDELVDALAAAEAEGIADERLVLKRTNDELRRALVAQGLSQHKANLVLQHFSLRSRPRWDETPAGFSAKDWYPWRYRRRLSLLARPFIQLGDANGDTVVFAPGLVRDSVELLINRLLTGQLPPEAFQSGAMRSWIGDITRRRGEEFEKEVGAKMHELHFETLVSRSMRVFGADKSYGDIDVFAWNNNQEDVYAIECKRLRFARTVAEIGEQLHEFQGAEMDRLARHLRRCHWLNQHLDSVRRVTGVRRTRVNIVPLLVTSTTVPMQFVNALPIPIEQVVPFGKLADWISGHP
jgi:hypothetical protein